MMQSKTVQASLKWRQKNREHFNEYQKQYMKLFYKANKDTVLKKKRGRDAFQKEFKRLCSIKL